MNARTGKAQKYLLRINTKLGKDPKLITRFILDAMGFSLLSKRRRTHFNEGQPASQPPPLNSETSVDSFGAYFSAIAF